MNPKVYTFFPVLLFVSAVSYICFLYNGRIAFGIDDANIYMVYMRHLAHGQGFVYNAGGEHVEGFSSVLWCLWGAFLYLFTGSPELLLLLSNVLFVSFCLWRLVCFVDDYFSDTRIISPNTLFLFVLLFLFPGYFEWTVLSLLETGLWSGLLILAALNLLQWSRTKTPRKLTAELCVWLVLLILTRPESLVYAPFISFVRFIQISTKDGRFRLSARAWVPALVTLLAWGLLTVFRVWYFGYPLPNTYYAKVSQDAAYNYSEGKKYLQQSLDLYVPVLQAIPMVLLVAAIILRKKRIGQLTAILTGFFLLNVLLPLYSGGDHFTLARTLQPTLPILYAGVGLLLRALLPLHGFYTQAKYMLMVPLLAGAVWVCGNPENQYRYGTGSLKHEFEIAMHGRYLGGELSMFFEELPKYPSQAVVCAGGFAYTYRGQTVDVMGLNNVAMAHADKTKARGTLKNHASFNKDVFLIQKPDIFWLNTVHFFQPADSGKISPPENDPVYKKGWLNLALKDIAYDPRFRETYMPTCIFKEGYERWILTHVHKDFIPKLSRPPYHCVVLPRAR